MEGWFPCSHHRRVRTLSLQGETVAADTLELFPGGKGANQAACAARLGYPTQFVGQVGPDGNGAFLLREMEVGLSPGPGCGSDSFGCPCCCVGRAALAADAPLLLRRSGA